MFLKRNGWLVSFLGVKDGETRERKRKIFSQCIKTTDAKVGYHNESIALILSRIEISGMQFSVFDLFFAFELNEILSIDFKDRKFCHRLLIPCQCENWCTLHSGFNIMYDLTKTL